MISDLPLRDIHLPPPIPWWPPAFGWWIVLGLIILCLIGLGWWIQRLLQASLKKQARAALAAIEAAFIETGNAAQCVSELSILLRRASISANPKAKSAGLTGKEWLQFLDQQIGQPEFSRGVGQILLNGPYYFKVDQKETEQFIELCRKWVERL